MSLKQLLDLTGRTALITGGSRGLGLQIAEGFLEMGARVVVSARKADELEAAVEQLSRLGLGELDRGRFVGPGRTSPVWPSSRSRGSATSTSSSTTPAPPGARRPRTIRRRRGTR